MIAVDPFAEDVVITVVEFPVQCRRLLPVFVPLHPTIRCSMAYRYRGAFSGPGWDPKWCFKMCTTFRNQAQPPSSNGPGERTQARGVGPSPLHSALHAPSRAWAGGLPRTETVGCIVGDHSPSFLCPHNHNRLGSRLGGDRLRRGRYRRIFAQLIGGRRVDFLCSEGQPILDLV
jgi:hypothetical protein